MNKENIIEVLKNRNLNNKLSLDDMPEIDLYMDQIMQLFENKLNLNKRNEEDKVLTKTMINNYAKAKLLMSINNKKYSKEHLILISFIYEFKGQLSISDIKLLLDNIVQKYENGEEYNLRDLYQIYLEICKEDSKEIEKNIKSKLENYNEESFEEKFLLIASIISIGNTYRKIAEVLVDELFGGNDNEKNK